MTDTHKALANVPPAALAPTEHMSPIVAAGMAILQAHPDAATLRELIALHKEQKADEAKEQYNAALLALRADLPEAIAKTKPVHGKGSRPGEKGPLMYRHAILADIMAAVTPALETHGFSATWIPACDGKLVTVRCRLHHHGGHSEEAVMSAPPDAGQNRNAVQAIGSTVTYLQRYTIAAMLGLAGKDQDDADNHPRESTSGVNSDRNLKAMAKLKNLGKTRAEAEAVVGRPMQEWTADDINRLRDWVVPPAAAAPAPEPDDLAAEAAAHDEELAAS